MILTIIHMINQLTKFTTTVIITTKLEMKMIMPAVMTPITALDVMIYIYFFIKSFFCIRENYQNAQAARKQTV